MIKPIPVKIGGIILAEIPRIIIAIAVRTSSAKSNFLMLIKFKNFVYSQI